MIYRGNLGTKSNADLQEAYEYFRKAEKLGNIAAKNSIGNMYLQGIYPLNKDLNKAYEYFLLTTTPIPITTLVNYVKKKKTMVKLLLIT